MQCDKKSITVQIERSLLENEDKDLIIPKPSAGRERPDEEVGENIRSPRELLENNNKELKKFELYRRMEFNSDRKRMSVLVRDPDDGLVKLYTKGAD
jgi:hypothetical protein